jgi:hypothetical protein
VGRFIGKDPIFGIAAWPASQNRYIYAMDNPANLLDPTGLCVLGAPCPKPLKDAANKGLEILNEGATSTVCSTVLTGYCALDLVLNEAGVTLGYLDANATYCGSGRCISAGVQFSPSQGGFHPYYLAGYGTTQAGLGLTFGPGQSITQGWSCAATGSYGYAVGQVGLAGIDSKEGKGLRGELFGELGLGLSSAPAGVVVACGYVF